MISSRLLDSETVALENDALALQVTRSFGPRILSLRLRGGENLFAEVPHLVLECPGKGAYRLAGGHRLWHAPEDPAITYLPDDRPVEIASDLWTLQVTQPVEPGTGIQKTILIHLLEDRPAVIIEHILSNLGSVSVVCAPWAITMMKPGGVSILPQNKNRADEAGVLPNRSLAFWPYTDPASSHITWGKNAVLVHADLASKAEKLKLGFPNPRGWLAYHRQDTLFVKTACYDPEKPYYDFNTSSQVYCEADFIELETLGPQVTLSPGGSVTHTEAWHVFAGIRFKPEDGAVQSLAEELCLDELAGSFVEWRDKIHS